jgi:hypothetical protein
LYGQHVICVVNQRAAKLSGYVSLRHCVHIEDGACCVMEGVGCCLLVCVCVCTGCMASAWAPCIERCTPDSCLRCWSSRTTRVRHGVCWLAAGWGCACQTCVLRCDEWTVYKSATHVQATCLAVTRLRGGRWRRDTTAAEKRLCFSWRCVAVACEQVCGPGGSACDPAIPTLQVMQVEAALICPPPLLCLCPLPAASSCLLPIHSLLADSMPA